MQVDPDALALLAALPWVLAPIIVGIRLRNSLSIDEYPAGAPSDAALVSVVIPARNEARNIERCLWSVLATTYPRVEIIVVDDQSDDDTGDLASAIARHDPRVLVFETPPLPRGWFGKQWACWTGAAKARGEILCFTDADTTHAPDLLPRSVNAMRGRAADLFTVMGTQEMRTIWEKLVQAQVFGMLNAWYGGTESVTQSKHSWRKIANGQFLMLTRAAYDDTGGHEAVRDTVAEDLALAQRFHRLGKRVVFMMGLEQLSTRMYASLRELVHGWGKNVYAGGIHALPPSRVLRALFPVGLLFSPLFTLAPVVGLLLGVAGIVPGGVLLWAIVATAATLLQWAVFYLNTRQPVWTALLFPLGALLTLFIFVRAIVRGRRVAWKDREYVAG